MPAGQIGSCWAPGSWEDTAWEAGSWAEAIEAVEQTPTAGSIGRRRKPFVEFFPEITGDVRIARARARVDIRGGYTPISVMGSFGDIFRQSMDIEADATLFPIDVQGSNTIRRGERRITASGLILKRTKPRSEEN
jgi:hypothetical protein